MKKLSYNKIAVAMVILFFVSLLPIFYCSFFDYATGDDLWEGAVVYGVLKNNGTIKDVCVEICNWVKTEYVGWAGNWSSIVLWSLEPSVWGEKAYCITPWISLVALCGGSIYFIFHFLKKYFAGSFAFLIITSIIVCFFSVHYMPFIRGGIFWYTGMINYVFPYGLCLASFVWIDKFLELNKNRYLIFSSLFFAYLGGAGYIPIVLAFEVIFFFIVFNLFSYDKKRKARALWLLLPFVLLGIGFIISAISPGNAVRGGEEYYFSIMRIFATVWECIRKGFFGGINWFISVRPLFLAVPLLGIVTWEQIDVEKVACKLKYPVFVMIFLFLISCSVYAPEIYSKSEVSGGVPDTIYFVFILAYVFSVIYFTCYIKKTALKKGWKITSSGVIEKLRICIVVGEFIFCIAAGRHLIGNMAGYVCIDFIRSGQLRDFECQMQERLEILHDPEITNVVLPEMNSEQGPFMHMALLADPNGYANVCTARFYGKESVVAIPRTEYYELYGYPEEKEN